VSLLLDQLIHFQIKLMRVTDSNNLHKFYSSMFFSSICNNVIFFGQVIESRLSIYNYFAVLHILIASATFSIDCIGECTSAT